jgi:hypothetical protein
VDGISDLGVLGLNNNDEKGQGRQNSGRGCRDQQQQRQRISRLNRKKFRKTVIKFFKEDKINDDNDELIGELVQQVDKCVDKRELIIINIINFFLILK